MKAIIVFAHAIADETRIRVAHLAAEHWISEQDLASVLSQKPSALSAHLAVLSEARLLKCGTKAGARRFRMRRKFKAVLEHLLARLRVSAKADSALKKDAKAAKLLRTSHRKNSHGKGSKTASNQKPAAKAKPKARPTTKLKRKKKLRPKPEGKQNRSNTHVSVFDSPPPAAAANRESFASEPSPVSADSAVVIQEPASA